MANQPQNNVQPEGVNRRGFLAGTVAAGAVIGGGLGAFYFGYEKAIGSPVRIGVIGTGDEGSVLLGALNPEFFEVKAIADIRPYSQWRAFHGDHYSEAANAVRSGLMAKYKWKTEAEARRHVKVFANYQDLIDSAKSLGIEAVVIATPLHLHAPVALAAMKNGLHVLTEKLMGHSVGDCKAMAKMARDQKLLLATGHQRHYNILYANAVDSIQRGTLGELHYIRAQWNRGNLPGHDSWQQPLPEKCKPNDRLAKDLLKKRKAYQADLDEAVGSAMDAARLRLEQVDAQIADAALDAKKYGYQDRELKDGSGNVVYQRPAMEELIRWRLWDRTGAGMMAELGSHQLDAADIFIHAAHKQVNPKAERPHPLNVSAVADRPLFPVDRDIEDHVYCLIEFPAPDYDAKSKFGRMKKIGVQYASVNGNGFGGYGEIVYGTKGTLILEKEQDLQVIKGPSKSKVKVSGAGGPTMDTQASGAPAAAAKKGGGEGPKVSRGYTEELEHWAWCIRNRDPENQPRCNPKAAMADAIIALTANISARQGKRIEFKEEWFDIDSPETPEKEFGISG